MKYYFVEIIFGNIFLTHTQILFRKEGIPLYSSSFKMCDILENSLKSFIFSKIYHLGEDNRLKLPLLVPAWDNCRGYMAALIKFNMFTICYGCKSIIIVNVNL